MSLANKLKFKRDRRYFRRIEPELINEGHKGEYALVHDKEVVAMGSDKVELAEDFYKKKGYKSFYIGKIGEREQANLRSPRILVQDWIFL